jgi:hypothetical protein
MARAESHAGQQGRSKQPSSKQSAKKGEDIPSNPVGVQKFLSGIDYPVQKAQLIEKARSEGADQKVIRALERLPDQQFGSPVAVSRELGKMM